MCPSATADWGPWGAGALGGSLLGAQNADPREEEASVRLREGLPALSQSLALWSGDQAGHSPPAGCGDLPHRYDVGGRHMVFVMLPETWRGFSSWTAFTPSNLSGAGPRPPVALQ